MQTIQLARTNLTSSRLIYGCMRIAESEQTGINAIHSAIDAGFNHFDHADIYAGGECERIFGKVLAQTPSLREQVIITSKAGIRLAEQQSVKRYDFSKNYLIHSVDQSLMRLNTDYLDVFLLHRPDYLMDYQQVADTFLTLKQQGKVKHFGVSNFSASQVAALQAACELPIVVNQIEINLHNIDSLTNGVLDQCQQFGITPMAWCPLAVVAYQAWGNTFSEQQQQAILHELKHQAEYYQTQPWLIALAWLLKHPAKICPIIGSVNSERIQQSVESLAIDYSHEHWYGLLQARNGEEVA